MDDVRWLTDDEIDTWLKFRAVVELYPGLLDAQLRRDAQLTHMEYQVLAMLSEVPDRTLRMTALAARTNGSLTRMSHVVTRLEQRGIVARSACALDGRATNVTLTDAGHDALVAAAPGHVTQVRESFLDALSPAQLGQLDAICDAILDRIDPEGKMTTR
ncbi:MarR family transcriptional regulator [Propioniciclava sp. MC1595]|uniref:MarR family winged helix-turn-helix transcriptional regulator n=1 Tax=unclassified Propioniciclava TaxID=2642922 RepID=UPI00160111DF|nr:MULTISPECIES: MarR family transcriptional regulator [unclassified Propioniciclava]MBB1494670.1 MarR family transcriptional regulator [Propioniciclava sp. MC1595]MBB1500433.1 MarR family transcriptional regulator [Propioniciclava sp. MC1683]QTE27338.1 MarR family transcriptional regulator [Propioniciclava sp. MC1595]